MIPLTLMHELTKLRNRRFSLHLSGGPSQRAVSARVLWIVDNTVELHSFIRGRAKCAALDQCIAFAKFLQALFFFPAAL
jgi:ABC-type arginine transport system ATPase subunit